jgi:intracellular septation protein
VAILATIIQVGISATILKKVEKMPLITLGLPVVFGGATLLLKDPLFIQWKPTAINWLFGLGFLLSQFIGKKPLVQRMMSQAISIDDDRVWLKLNLSWVLFFALSGLANLLVAPAIDPLGFGFTESTWVDFKLFGLMGMTIAFVIAQAFYLSRFMNTTAEGHD